MVFKSFAVFGLAIMALIGSVFGYGSMAQTADEAENTCLTSYLELPPYLQSRPVPNEMSDDDTLSLADHERHCLEHWEELRQKTQKAIENSFGVLFVNGELTPRCFAFPVEANKLATALHCIQNIGRSDRLHFALFSNPEERTKVLLNLNRKQITDTHDVAFLYTETPIKSVKTLQSRRLPPRTWMLIPTMAVAQFHLASQKGNIPQWNDFVRVDIEGSCYSRSEEFSIGIPDSCIVHSCQTNETTSGSPIFFRSSETAFSIGGMHIRSGWLPNEKIGSPDSDCGYHPGNFNIGVRVGFVN